MNKKNIVCCVTAEARYLIIQNIGLGVRPGFQLWFSCLLLICPGNLFETSGCLLNGLFPFSTGYEYLLAADLVIRIFINIIVKNGSTFACLHH